MNKEMDNNEDLEQRRRDTPYLIPEGFFEEVQRQVGNRIRQHHKRVRIVAFLSSAVVAAAVVLCLLYLPLGRIAGEGEMAQKEVQHSSSRQGDKWIEELSDEDLKTLVTTSDNDVFLNK
jgi:chromosome condensin MukBEF MukE localization factor